MRRLKIDPWKAISLILAAVLLVSFVSGQNWLGESKIKGVAITKASASEIYPLFFCPCCGKPLDKNNICCEQAKERIDYIDSQAAEGKSQEEIILAYVKKYGLNSFVDKNKAQEIKEELLASAPADRPIISISPQTIDLGEVSQKKGKISTVFALENQGKTDLVIDKLGSSCGCTSAAIVFEGKEGPLFAMEGHGIKNPTDWQVKIPAGGKAQLKVYYDPDVHKDFRGAATREIYLFSNDPVEFETKVMVELNQVD